ncbi:hypothetical protein [Streptomyces sp. NBC_00233]|uniref:hypothetical protein n=1 Tax=Streptomyces sp. NBC_00233 TaxID=2975686 RepID=UPI0022546EEC|nr:hypothetical protein [Streptomyces sp. NBC_00233]MCX5230427.1 hypothetical protein [Streptomyces sp. NBC_00233]
MATVSVSYDSGMDGRVDIGSPRPTLTSLTPEEYRTSSCRACGRRGDPARKRGGPGPGAAVRALVRAGEAGHSTVGIVLAAVALALMPLPMI